MTTKKEKVEFVRSQQFEAVDDELSQAMSLLEEKNARIAELLSSEARGDLPFLNMPPDASEQTAEAAAADVQPANEGTKKATPRVRRARQTNGEDN